MTKIKQTLMDNKLAAVLAISVVALSIFSGQALQYTSAIGEQTTVDVMQKIQAAHDKLTQKMANRDTADIPLVLSWPDTVNQTLIVGIDSDAPLPKAVYTDRLKSIVGDVPMKISFGKLVRDACNTKTSNCSPLWGGIQVQSSSPFGSTGTLTLPTTNTAGKVGFIISGHIAGNGVTGQTIGQATTARIVGTVITNPILTNRVSDSAFVERSAGILTESKIWKSSTSAFNVIGKTPSSSTPIGATVLMQGITSAGVRSGSIQGKGLTVSDSLGTLRNQVAASYSSQAGDSGAPIFAGGAVDVNFYGIHVARWCINEPGNPHPPCTNPADETAIYSPWEGIQSELSVN